MLWDSVALVSYQIPIYALSGASGQGILRGALGATGIMLTLGRPYGAFLNRLRALFGLSPGGSRPMSLEA